MKSGQLIEKNMRNIFLEKSYKNVVQKLLPDPFLQNQKYSCLSVKFNILYTLILWYALVEDYQNMLKLSCWPPAFNCLYKSFLKNRKRSGTSLPAFFSALISKKLFL